jgi:RNA polymerase sigma factor (TIGR02999 family)
MSDASSPQPASSPGDFTILLQRADTGDAQAADQILPLVYGELRRLAAAKIAREAPGHTLQPTALVHEAWLRLGGDAQPQWKSRAHFFSAAAEAMRRILIESARRRLAARHGGGLERVSVNSTGFDVAAPEINDADLLLLHEALDSLALHDRRRAEMVKQWYFVGLSLAEIAALLDISLSTANRDIRYARAWLGREILRLRPTSAPSGEPD